MKETEVSSSFTIADIRTIRERCYEKTLGMTRQERIRYFNSLGSNVRCEIAERKAGDTPSQTRQGANYAGMYGTDGRPVAEILSELDELAGDGEDYDDPEEDAQDVADIDRIMSEIEAGKMKVYTLEEVEAELGL